MRLLSKRPLAAALFVFFAGFFLFSRLSFLFRTVFFFLSVITGIILVCLKKKRSLPIASAFLLALAALLLVLTSDLPDYEIGKRLDSDGRYSFRLLEQTDEDENLWLVGSVKDGDGRLFCRLTVDLPDAFEGKAGDVLAGEGRIVRLSAYARNGLYGRGCRGKLVLSGEVEKTGRTPSLRAPFARFSKTVCETIRSRVEGDGGGLLVAVLLGETEELPTGTDLLFRRVGVAHALAVSGMHLVFLSAALSFLLRRLRIPRPAIGVSVVLFAFFYAALAGFTPSVLRAALMLAFYEASWFAKRQPDSLTSLALSGALMLLFAPSLIFSVSFLLSYLATLGILIAAQFTRSGKKKRALLPSLLRRVGSFLLMTLFALLFTLPVTCALFGELPLLSIPANLLFSLPIQFLLYLSVAVLALPFPFVSAFAERSTSLFLFLFRRFASLPLAPLTFSAKILAIAGALPVLALLAVAVFGFSKRKRIVLCSVAGALTVAAFLIFALPVKVSPRPVLLSNGKDDDLIVLRSGTRAACVDLGDSDGVLSLLRDELKSDRIAEIDRYVVPNYDAGTAIRIGEILSSVYVRRFVLIKPKPCEAAGYDALVSLLDRVDVDYTVIEKECELFGYALRFIRSDPAESGGTVPVALTLSAGEDRLLYVDENVLIPREGYSAPDGTTLLFLGSRGDTRYFAFRLGLPESVKTLYTANEFYLTCTFTGGATPLERILGRRFAPDGFVP